MRLHANARTGPHSRRLAIRRLEQGWRLRRAAEAAGVSVRTISKWRRRYRVEAATAWFTVLRILHVRRELRSA